MKRRDILRRLVAAGYTLEEGGRHTIVRFRGRKVSVVSRQREIEDNMVRVIEKQTGLNLT